MAGSIVCVGDDIYRDIDRSVGGVVRVLALKLTHHTDNSLSVTLNDSVSGLKHGSLYGWQAWIFQTYPGATAPTDATDMTIADDYGLDILGAGGTNMVDATTGQEFYAEVNNIAGPRPISTDLTIATANNAVASAVFTMRMYMVPVGVV